MKKKQILMIMTIMLLSITLFALNDMGKGGSYDGVALLASGVINLGNVASAVDFPANQGTDVGGGTTITPTADLNYAQDQTIPPTPNSNFIAGYEGVFTGSGILTISISTSYQYGAYYQNGSWYSQVNSGGTILFENLNFDAKGDIPIILGNDNPLPVVLSSFTAIQTSTNLAQLSWVTESEANLLGYHVYRNTENNADTSVRVNSEIILGTNMSTQQHYTFTDNSVKAETEYYYWLENVEYSGTSYMFGPISIVIENNDDNNSPPTNMVFGLHQNYPNPFNPSTEIRFAVKKAGNAKLTVYNVKGQKVTELYNGYTNANTYITATWNGKDNEKKKVTSGVYFYKLTTDKGSFIKKMIMMK